MNLVQETKGPISNQVLSEIIEGIYNHMNWETHPDG